MADDQTEKKDGEVNEPGVTYNGQPARIRIYNSFDEQAADEARAAAAQSPLERIRETVQLILRVYGLTQEELNKRPKSRHITITRYE